MVRLICQELADFRPQCVRGLGKVDTVEAKHEVLPQLVALDGAFHEPAARE
jgi:hypothetical protein